MEPPCARSGTSQQYDSGYTGVLRVARNNGDFAMSTCLTLSEPQTMPQTVLHSLRLWIPTLDAK